MAFLRMLEWRAKYGVTPLRVCGPSLDATIYISSEMQASLLRHLLYGAWLSCLWSLVSGLWVMSHKVWGHHSAGHWPGERDNGCHK